MQIENTPEGVFVTRRSPVTNQDNRRHIVGATIEQIDAWCKGTLIQVALPNVSADDREFLISGCTPEDWNKLFPPEEEEGEETASMTVTDPDKNGLVGATCDRCEEYTIVHHEDLEAFKATHRCDPKEVRESRERRADFERSLEALVDEADLRRKEDRENG